MLENSSLTYFIKGNEYVLECKKNKNKKDLIPIGDFFKILENENIKNVTLKKLREWDNKKLLPAYRVSHGPIREKVRYYSNEHIVIIKAILYLKSIGFEIPDIKKVIFNNIPIDLVFFYKNIEIREEFKKMKEIIFNINDMENDIVLPIIKNIKSMLIKKYSDKIINDENIEKVIESYKNSDLNSKDDDINTITLILILLSASNSYNDEKEFFDRDKFSKYMDNIVSKY